MASVTAVRWSSAQIRSHVAGDSSSECGDGFECRDGACITDRRGPSGSTCTDDADCIDSQCAAQGERAWCTASCVSDAECPSGFECTSAGAGSVCAPTLALDGEPCEGNEACVSGLCAALPDGRSLCTQLCGAHDLCVRGVECVPTSDGVAAVCVPPMPDAEGCSVGHAASGRTPWGLSLFCLALLFVRRKRSSTR